MDNDGITDGKRPKPPSRRKLPRPGLPCTKGPSKPSDKLPRRPKDQFGRERPSPAKRVLSKEIKA